MQGVIPRAARQIFETCAMKKEQAAEAAKQGGESDFQDYEIKCSYLEIYEEKVCLLSATEEE